MSLETGKWRWSAMSRVRSIQASGESTTQGQTLTDKLAGTSWIHNSDAWMTDCLRQALSKAKRFSSVTCRMMVAAGSPCEWGHQKIRGDARRTCAAGGGTKACGEHRGLVDQ